MAVEHVERKGLIVCIMMNKDESVPDFIKSHTKKDKNFIFESEERLTEFKEQKEVESMSNHHYEVTIGNGMNTKEIYGYFDEETLKDLRERLVTFACVDLATYLSMKEKYGYWKVLGVYLKGKKDEAYESLYQSRLYANQTFNLNDESLESKIENWLNEELSIRNLE